MACGGASIDVGDDATAVADVVVANVVGSSAAVSRAGASFMAVADFVAIVVTAAVSSAGAGWG